MSNKENLTENQTVDHFDSQLLKRKKLIESKGSIAQTSKHNSE
jgi:hypothetical protein